MKKTILALSAAVALMLSSCMTTGMGTTTNTSSNNNVLGSVLGSVLSNVLFGGSLFDASSILGSWSYNAPSTAFTTEKALTSVGGNAVVNNISTSLASNYNNIGIPPQRPSRATSSRLRRAWA